jgi:ArsR family transcriptional regulator
MAMSVHNPKRALSTAFAEVAKGLGHAHRLELLEQLGQGERSVEELAGCLGLPFASASQHLQRLRRAGLALARRQGKRVLYRLSDERAVPDLLSALRRVAERGSAEVERLVAAHFRTRDALEPVTREELLARLRKGRVTVIDVRPADEFALGHLPGASNVPLSELQRWLAKLPHGREVVAYCRGPYCVLSFDAVAALRAQGYRARRMEDGYPEWKAAGLPVEPAGAA